MNYFLRKYWILIAILILAAGLRLWHLESIPPSLTQDEAALGYNAYSILKTGKDEYGKVLPIIFKSFGDYKPGMYVYLDVPFIATLGLNEISVRLPSAIAGVLSVFLIYLIIKNLNFGNSLEIGNWKTSAPWSLEIAASFVAATNPWLIFFSRGAWEVNIALTLTLAAIYFFLRALTNSKYIILSSSLFALTLLTYQGAKLSTALVVLILITLYWKELFKLSKKYLLGSVGIAILISAPIVLSLFNGETGRLDVFSIFSYPRPANVTQTILNEGQEKLGSISYDLFHSVALDTTRGILWRYFNTFSAKFLFFEGDYQNPQHSAPYQGMLLISDIAVLLYGFIVVARGRFNKPIVFILLWLILSPLPAVLTRDQVQSVRALNMVIPLVIILAFGLTGVLELVQKQKFKVFLYSLFVILYSGSILYFLDAYYIHVPAHNSQYWNYGYKQVVQAVTPIQKNYKNITMEQSFAQPYIYFLFYQKYDPAKYQKQATLTASANVSDVGVVSRLDKIQFSSIDWSNIRNQHGQLVIVDGVTPIPQDLSYEEIDKINFLNGRDPAFEIIKIK